MSAYDRLKEQFASVDPPRSLFPLLWLHGDERETESVIRREIAAMDEAMCGGFVIESRPHNDYLGERWWQDIGYCLDEAAHRSMDVWLLMKNITRRESQAVKSLPSIQTIACKCLLKSRSSGKQK